MKNTIALLLAILLTLTIFQCKPSYRPDEVVKTERDNEISEPKFPDKIQKFGKSFASKIDRIAKMKNKTVDQKDPKTL